MRHGSCTKSNKVNKRSRFYAVSETFLFLRYRVIIFTEEKLKGEPKEVKAKKLELNQETLKNLIQKQYSPNALCTLHSDQSFVNTGCMHTQCACGK